MRTLVVHGGAGSWPENLRGDAQAGLARALDAGWAAPPDPLEMVVAAARVLEENPLFNAGVGASLTSAGTVEHDAGLMRGSDLEVGAVASVSRLRSPILAARAVLEHSAHALLVGPGAEDFALAHGGEEADPETFVVDRRRQQLERWRSGDTIGAVAWVDGRLAAACSTGGYTGKLPGRVGDSPLPGAGYYADDACGAAVCTGTGEYFMRLVVAYQACRRMGAEGAPEASAAVIAELGRRLGGTGGLIAIDRQGQVGAAYNTAWMPHASRSGE